MRRLLSAVAALAGIGATFMIAAGAASAQFEKTQLVGDESAGQPNTLNPMEIEVAPDGTVFYTERRGVLGAWDPETESARVIGTLPVTFPAGENGLMGIALDPDYASNGWIYLSYSVSPASTLTQRVSRFQLDGDGDLDLASEVPIFEWTHLREPDSCCHAAGALEFDPDGNLLITTGDNVNPFASQGYAPIDERPGREVWDAQRTSANTNDHNGKLLRITPNELITPGAEPGIGTTYSIPEGNMFPVGTEDTLPEIHSMGFRNPFRFKVDEETGWTLLADYGPDAGQGNPARGPQGSVEFNVIQEPINSGWPYCIRATVPYIDFDFETNQSGEPFDCENPVNDSPNNTGLTNLPPTFPATMWQGFSETDPRYPGLGTNGAPMSGPRYYYDPSNPSPTKFPEEFDGKWFIASWNNDWIRTVDLDSEGTPSNVQNFPSLNYLSPMDMEFGPDGALYLAEWGQGFDQDNPDSGIYRIDHVGGVAPQVTASAEPDSGTVPLDVQFEGEATNPDGTPNPNFEYEWDFDDGNTSNQEDPTHTYTEPGTYEATLTVTDPETDEQGTDTVQIRVEQASSCPTGLSDEFDGTELDPKWEVVRRDDERLSVSDGALNLLAHPDDIFGGTNGNLANVVLQPLPGGGDEPWSITTELTWEPDTNFQNAGLMIYEDDDNYIKAGMVWNGARNFELVKETDANPTFPGGSTSAASVGDTFFLRFISDDGNSVDAQFSADGQSWTDIGTTGTDLSGLSNPRIGVYATAAGAPEITASFHSVTFEPDVAGGGDFSDEFDGTSLDTTKWNSIVREQEDLYEVSDGQLHVTTVNGDIYEGGDPTPTRNFFLQTPDHAGADWTIETQIDASELSGGYEQAGLMAYEDDANYIKYDILSDDGQTVLNRIELRSEEGDVIQSPMPQVTSADPEGFPGVVWLRLTKTGDMYSGEYSFDGETFESLGEPVQNDMGAPRFGIYTLGQLSGGGTAHFEYFSIEGETPCPENEPPVIESVTADPDSGDAPLEVDFTAEASDPDGDDLTYEWDFDDGGTSNQQNPTHTYTDPGVYEAEVTVSDGEAQVSDSVTVTVTGGPEPRFRVLAFSETAGFRHTSIDEGHAALDALAAEHDFAVDHTEDSSAFTEANLANYDTVAFLSTTGDVLDEAQEDAFEAYIQGGGGYTGIHSASDTEYEWPWYGELVGAYFRNHPPGTPTATVGVEDHDHASTTGLPDSYVKVDEWYNFQSPIDPVIGGGGDDYSPRPNVHVLATVDESTYDEQDGNATDDDHPIIWCQRYDGGLSWYTGMGHTEASFSEPEFLQQVLGGLETTAGVEPSATCGFETGEPDLTTRVQPRRDKVKVGKRARFEFTVRNRGDAAAEAVQLCVKAPKRKVKVLGAACRETPSLGKGASVDATFRLKPKRRAAGDRINVRFIATAANADRASDSATLKVEKKKRKKKGRR